MTTLLDRFTARIEWPSSWFACWPWAAYRHPVKGYGRFHVGGGKYRNAHRVGYELIVGEVPPGMVLDHLCRNRWCVNPLHLEPVTPRENALRGEGPSAINATKERCPNGHEYRQVGRVRRCVVCDRESDIRAGRNQGNTYMKSRTHCPAGHAYDEANTYTDPLGYRHCRRCKNERRRRASISQNHGGNIA